MKIKQTSYYFYFVLIIFLFNSKPIFSQLNVGGGLFFVKGFTEKTPFTGLTVLAEKMDDMKSIYAHFSMTLNNKSDDIFINQYLGYYTYRYNTLEIGKRNYFGNDIEFGLGYYFSEHLTIAYNTVGINLKDTTINVLPPEIPRTGNILAISVGGNIGAQYAFVRGIIFIEGGFNYALFGTSNNITSANYISSFSPLNFTVNLGYKKTLNFGY